MTQEARSAARDRYDTAKFTDREIEDELNNVPPRHRSDAYLTALRAERDRRSQDRGPRHTRSSEVGSVPDTKEGTDGGHGTSSAASGCYKCGEPVREFGGFVSPGVVDFLTGRCFPQVARWWTKCKDCGYVEVRS